MRRWPSRWPRGARERLRATYGLSTTGEAGPTSASGSPVGTIFIAVAGPRGTVSRRLDIPGSREMIQSTAVEGALLMLAQVRASGTSGPSSGPGASSAFETGLGNIDA